MKFKQALVVYKQLDPAPSKKRNISEGHELHIKTLDMLYPLLRNFGISFGTCPNKQLRTIKNVDLIITVGGDGTVLRTSHFLDSIPIVGIKSYGKASIGYFCAASTETMCDYLESLFRGQIKPRILQRLQISLNGCPVKELALNDMLFAHSMPASMAKYRLTVGKRCELHRSSGIWVSSAAGSTAAVSAAGGKTLPLGAKKMEYVVREPYTSSEHYKLKKGILSNDIPIKIESLTNRGSIFIDGSHIQYPAPEGTTIEVQGSNKPLRIFWKK